ncbi:MAG: Lrp/AsnC family transcriptional regulator, partial [Actinomycetota bacterium]
MALEIPLDATDEAILRALQEDGRRSYRSVARDVGVSEGTVRARVRKLEQREDGRADAGRVDEGDDAQGAE